MDDQKISRTGYYNFHRSEIYALNSYYNQVFAQWANEYKLEFEHIAIGISDEWSDNRVTQKMLCPGVYTITLAKGIVERLSHLVRLISGFMKETNTLHFEIYEGAWKNSQFSFYDAFDRVDYPIRDEARILLSDGVVDIATYEADFSKFFSQLWPRSVMKDRIRLMPFLWVIDFLVYHEMSHLLLRHSAYLSGAMGTNHSIIAQSQNDPFYQNHLIELHADQLACSIAIQTLPEFIKALNGEQITELMERNMFEYAFLIILLFSILDKSRVSYNRFRSYAHPHPDFRKLMVFSFVSELLGNGSAHSSAWKKQFTKAFFSVQDAFYCIGADGFGNSILNPYSNLLLSAYGQIEFQSQQQDALSLFCRYRFDLDNFVQYLHQFELNFSLPKQHNYAFDSTGLHFENPFMPDSQMVLVIHSYSDTQFGRSLVDHYLSKK